MENRLLSTRQAAEILNISPMRVRALIGAGRLPSQQIGRDHLIKESDLALVIERKAGRPKKKPDEEIAPDVKKWKAEQQTLPGTMPAKRKATAKKGGKK